MNNEFISNDYGTLLTELKDKVRLSQQKAALKVNSELILLYWSIGKKILENQGREGWGTKVVDLLAKDLSESFPDMKGFSVRNLKYMRSFAEAYPKIQIVQQVVAQLPWYHNCVLLDKAKTKKERLWYVKQTIENGWSRNVLVHHIESKLYKRQEKEIKAHNFNKTLPSPQSDLATAVLKDPYVFDFLSISKEAGERELEGNLTEHITKFLLELGSGFAYVGRQVHLAVGGQDFYIDLLFYHLKLRCYVVLELKTGDFNPEYAGKMNFYLSAVDDLLRHEADKETIGIILCQQKEKIIVEYALRNLNKPMGVSKYQIVENLPQNLKGSLPTVEEIEKELDKKNGKEMI